MAAWQAFEFLSPRSPAKRNTVKLPAAEDPSVPDASPNGGGNLVQEKPSQPDTSPEIPAARIRSEKRMLIFLAILQVLQGALVGLFGVALPELAASFRLPSSGVVRLILAHCTLQKLVAPAWAALADYVPNRLFMAVVCACWGCLALLIAVSYTFELITLMLLLYGAGLSALGPFSISIIGRNADVDKSGLWFGELQFTGGLGGVLVRSVAQAATWRFVFSLMSALCFTTSASICFWIFYDPEFDDPEFDGALDRKCLDGAGKCACGTYLARIRRVCGRLSFWVLLVQGILNGFAMNAMTYVPMYVMFRGFSGGIGEFTANAVGFLGLFGPIVGGYIGDGLARQYHLSGRPFLLFWATILSAVATIGVILANPACELLTLAVPLAALSFIQTWTNTGVKLPVILGVLDSHDWSFAFAIMSAVEGIFAAFISAPIVGIAAEQVFNYHHFDRRHFELSAMEANADAIMQSLLIFAVPALVIQAVVISPLLFYSIRGDQQNQYFLIDAFAEATPLSRRNLGSRLDIKTCILHLTCGMHILAGACTACLSASSDGLIVDFLMNSEDLSRLMLVQASMQALVVPAWSWFVAHLDRHIYLATVCACWSISSFALAVTPVSFQVLAVMLGIHGATLSALVPFSQGVVGSCVAPDRRGIWFGLFQFSLLFGGIAVTAFGGVVGDASVIGGFRGWRALCIVISLMCMLEAVLLAFFTTDSAGKKFPGTEVGGSVRGRSPEEMLSPFPTSFWVLVVHGWLGSVANSAMTLMPLYVLYHGHSLQHISKAVVAAGLFSAISPVLGGSVGDQMARWNPIWGRPVAMLIASLAAFVTCIILLLTSPGSTTASLAGMLAAWNIVMGWAPAAGKLPILSEVTDATQGPFAVGIIAALEGVFSVAVASPLVSSMTDMVWKFHEHDTSLPKGEFEAVDAGALGQTMQWLALPCLFSQVLVCPLLIYTYGRDVSGRSGLVDSKFQATVLVRTTSAPYAELPARVGLKCRSGYTAITTMPSLQGGNNSDDCIWELCTLQFLHGLAAGGLVVSMGDVVGDFLLSNADLSKMLFLHGTLQILATPAWALLAHRISLRMYFLSACTSWGILTLLLSCSISLANFLPVLCLHGMSLSAIGPVAQASISQSVSPGSRGTSFGCLFFAESIGGLLTSSFGSFISENAFFLGLRGWRAVLLLTACCCFAKAVSIALQIGHTFANGEPLVSIKGTVRSRIARIFRTPSFQVLLLHAALVAFTNSAATYLPMYMSYSANEKIDISVLATLSSLFVATGPLVGGCLSDRVAHAEPADGRPVMMVAIGLSTACAGAGFVLTVRNCSPAAVATMLAAWTFFSGWGDVCVKLPVLTEVLDPDDQILAYALIKTLESGFGIFFAAPLVGATAEQVFHYHFIDHRATKAQLADHDARALERSLLWMVVPPLLLQAIVVFPLLRSTYWRDVEHQQLARRFGTQVVDDIMLQKTTDI